MALAKEVYSANRVNLIYQLLKNEADNGTPKEYDVKVDELKVVSRTNDPERFYSHEEFVLPETRNITINIYDSKSHRCTRYILLLREEEPSKQELSGIEKSINTKMLQERKKWESGRNERVGLVIVVWGISEVCDFIVVVVLNIVVVAVVCVCLSVP